MKVTLVKKVLNNGKCTCVGKHVPLPQTLYEVEHEGEVVFLCPTSYWNLISFHEEHDHQGTPPPGSVRKHYSEFIQNLYRKLS